MASGRAVIALLGGTHMVAEAIALVVREADTPGETPPGAQPVLLEDIAQDLIAVLAVIVPAEGTSHVQISAVVPTVREVDTSPVMVNDIVGLALAVRTRVMALPVVLVVP
jgi:hypothetical protein